MLLMKAFLFINGIEQHKFKAEKNEIAAGKLNLGITNHRQNTKNS